MPAPKSKLVGPDGRPLKKERRSPTGKARSRRTAPSPITSVGTANLSEAPGAFRRMFRFSQLSVGTAGAGRSIDDIWATFLNEMDDLKIGDEARSRMESLGPRHLLGKKGFPKSVTGVMEMGVLREAKETLTAARAALKGVEPGQLVTKWGEMLDDLAKDEMFQTPDGRRILKELRAVDPKVVARVGSNQALSVLARRGEDPFFLRQFNRLFKREGTAVLPQGMQEMLKMANKGKLPKVAGATVRALEKGGLAAGAGLGRKAVGLLGKTGLGAAGIGVIGAMEAHRAFKILGREGRAKKLALQGFEGLGPSSSVDFLRDIVDKQETVARRKVTMQKFEPELFQEVVRMLSDTGQSPNTLTSTERRIGADAQLGVQRRGRSGEDVRFLLDQLFSQMGGGGQ